MSKIDKKDLALEKSLLLDDSKSINVCARSLKPYIVADIKKYRFSVMNIIILYILAYMSFILMSPDFSAPHLGKDHTNIFFYTFFVRQHMLILNTMLFYLLYRFIYGIIGRFWTSVILNYAVIAVAIVADAIKTHYRTEPILPTEVTMVSAYGDILSMLPQFILWITAIVIIILICIVIYCERKLPQNKAKWRFRILGIVLAVLVYGSSTRINHEGSIVGDFLNSYGNLPTFKNQEQGAQQNGALQQFLNNIDVTIMKKETDYSKEKVDKLARKYSKLANEINVTRDNNLATQTVIFNLSESLANPNRLKEIELSQNPLSYIDSIKENTTSGLMISSGLGGGTANMEYMTLTGLPVSNFSPTIATPYTQVVPESKQTLTINGYFKKSTAIHPYNGSFYSRKAVYQKFGFQRFMYLGSKYKINHKMKIGSNPYLSDETAYSNTLDVINSYKNGQFINLVTMQNHMPYLDYYDNSGDYQVSGDMDDNEKNIISNYSAGLSYTIRPYKNLLNK